MSVLLPGKCLISAWSQSGNHLVTVWQLPYVKLDQMTWFYVNLMTFWWLFDDFLMTFWWSLLVTNKYWLQDRETDRRIQQLESYESFTKNIGTLSTEPNTFWKVYSLTNSSQNWTPLTLLPNSSKGGDQKHMPMTLGTTRTNTPETPDFPGSPTWN